MLENIVKFLQHPSLTLHPSQTVATAVSQMTHNGTSFALVLEDGSVKGIFTERDIVRLISSQGNLENLTLSEVMTPNVMVIRESEIADIFQISTLFNQYGVRHLPVLDRSEQLLGVLTPESVSSSMTPEYFLRNVRTQEALVDSVVEGQSHESVLHLAQRMATRAVSCVAIVDSSNHHPLGIITERDIAQFHALGLDLQQTTAASVMSQPLFTVQPSDLLWSVLDTMQCKHVRRLVVVHPSGELAGLVTHTDILNLLNPAEMHNVMAQMQKTIDRQTEQLKMLNRTLKLANDELNRKASLDSLTQLSNRRCFDEYLSDVWEWLSRERGELTLIICDVDFFKAYNDLYGHVEGDACLSTIAQSLKQVVRSSTDLVARYGGEEFVIILPKCDVQGAERAAQTILERIRKLNIPHAGSSVSGSISISIGAATVTFPSASEPRSLLKLADQKLYQSKLLGRDRASFGVMNSRDISF